MGVNVIDIDVGEAAGRCYRFRRSPRHHPTVVQIQNSVLNGPVRSRVRLLDPKPEGFTQAFDGGRHVEVREERLDPWCAGWQTCTHGCLLTAWWSQYAYLRLN